MTLVEKEEEIELSIEGEGGREREGERERAKNKVILQSRRQMRARPYKRMAFFVSDKLSLVHGEACYH